MAGQIDSVMTESRLFPVPPAFAQHATLNGMAQYDALCQEAERDHAGFWARLAREQVLWHKPFSRSLDDTNAPFFKWFEDGDLNVSFNSRFSRDHSSPLAVAKKKHRVATHPRLPASSPKNPRKPTWYGACYL